VNRKISREKSKITLKTFLLLYLVYCFASCDINQSDDDDDLLHQNQFQMSSYCWIR